MSLQMSEHYNKLHPSMQVKINSCSKYLQKQIKL